MSRPSLRSDGSIFIPVNKGKFSGSTFVTLRRPTMVETVDVVLSLIYVGMGRPDEMRVSVERPCDDSEPQELYRSSHMDFDGSVDVYGVSVNVSAVFGGLIVYPAAGVNIEFAD